MKYSELEKLLSEAGCRPIRKGGNHPIWKSPVTGKIFPNIMNTVKAFIERGNDGTYGVYVDLDDNSLNYGVIGEGHTVQEAIEDFKICYREMKELHEEENLPFVEAEFEFHYDTSSFLDYYTNYFSLAGLSRLTGIHQGQLSHYLTGVRNPSKRTIQRIDSSIHHFAKNLSQVQFV
jgi:predicted RNase H-like HicB family nuclease